MKARKKTSGCCGSALNLLLILPAAMMYISACWPRVVFGEKTIIDFERYEEIVLVTNDMSGIVAHNLSGLG
ncbi:MAG: hypothetical protein AABZ85_02005, partial [Thermodesulfobacteriota bacterium]